MFRAIRHLIPIAVAGLVWVGAVSTAQAAVYHVVGTGGAGLNVRGTPSTGGAVVGHLAEGQSVDIQCQIRSGSYVNGTDVWDRISSGYVSDYYMSTPVYGNYSPGLPICGSGGSAIEGNNYPGYLRNAGQDTVVDPWRFYNRECTSFVAFRMNEHRPFSNGMTGPNGRAGWFGNAGNWAANAAAIGFRVDTTPTVGSIAQWNVGEGGTSGHVAQVVQVNSNGTVVVEEYNFLVHGGYDLRTTRAPRYIHIYS